jgi:hypothetical protein
VAVKRGKPLRRRRKLVTKRAPMPRTRRRSKYRQRERHTDYMLFVKTLRCCAANLPGHTCSGPIEADHANYQHGKGEKCHDSEVISLCKRGHEQKTNAHGPGSGPFKGWDLDRMREWLLEQIAHTQRTARACGVVVPEAPPQKVPWRRDRDLILVAPSDSNLAITVLASVERAPCLAEDLREVGNVDVRNPDAAPLSVARVVSKGTP